MEGLSAKKRRVYLSVLTLIFFVAAPAVALYATGYRISSDFEIIKTGGIHVEVPTSGALFYLDDEFAGSGTIFQKSFFTQNLTPGVYTVRVEKEGYLPWQKELEVFPTVISDARALLLPENPVLTLIPDVVDGGARAGTRAIENPRYREILDAFAATSTGVVGAPLGATTTVHYNNATTTVYERSGVGLWIDEAGLHAWWLRDAEDSPYVFCKYTECEREIVVWSQAEEISHFDFFPDSNVFVALERSDGVVITELDTRAPQNIQPLYLQEGAKFRIIEGTIYILDDADLFEVEL